MLQIRAYNPPNIVEATTHKRERERERPDKETSNQT
jgi:hypothetical protein